MKNSTKKITGWLCGIAFAVSLQAQTVKDAFIAMPEQMLPDLNVYSRMDLIDLYNAGQVAAVINHFNDSLVLENLTQDYLRLNTGNGSLQMIVLQMINESQLYCLIRTVCSPVCDSRIEFYSPSWNRLKSEIFITPVGQPGCIAVDPACPALDVTLTQWLYDPGTSTLQQIYNTLQYLSLEDRKIMDPLIQEREKAYDWSGIRFELRNH